MAQSEAVNSDDRLKQINEELGKILEDKIEFLTRTLSETQRFSQKIANTELEIQRNTSQHSRLKAEQEELKKELDALVDRVAEASSARDAQQQEKYAKEKEIQRLEWEIADRRKANEEDSGRIRAFEVELEGHEKENKKLKNRVTGLEEGVARMRKIRDEYMQRIAGLDEEMKNVSGGGE